MTASPLRVGLVGYGLAGRVLHAPLVAAADGLVLDAVVTRDPDRAARVRSEHPGAAVVADLPALVARRPDVVVVAGPNALHVPMAEVALRAGAAVVVDKPVALSAEAALRLVDLAASLGRVLTVFHQRRWDADFRTVEHLVGTGELGRIATFESRMERWKPVERPGWKRGATAADGGGVLWDLGPHLVDQALRLFGPVAEVHAEIATRRPGSAADDDAFVSLRHASGVRSRLWASSVAGQPGPRFRVLGDRAAYVVTGSDPQEARLASGASPTDPGFGDVAQEAWGTMGAGDDVRPVPTLPGTWHRFTEGLVAAVRTGAPPPVDPLEAVEVLAVLERARAAAAVR